MNFTDNYMVAKMDKMNQIIANAQNRMTEMSKNVIEAMESDEFSWLEMQSMVP